MLFNLLNNSVVSKLKLKDVSLLMRIILLLIVITISRTNGQWQIQCPVPTHLGINGISSPTAERIFIATDDDSFDDSGSLFESNDGGNTWVQRNIPLSSSNSLYGIFFFDNQNGWVYGNDNYHTTDGGTTWTQIPSLGSTYFMKFYSSVFGLSTGNFGQYVSRDGGFTWELSPNEIFSFDFINNQNGLGVSGNGIYKTTNGGITFTLVYPGAADAVIFLSDTLAVGIVDSLFVRSVDGGETWNPLAPTEGKNKLFAVSGEVILAWGRSGVFPNYDDRVFRSSDGGQTWIDLGVIITPGSFTSDLTFVTPDNQTVVATDGAGNMFRSTDAGQNWVQTFTVPSSIQPGFLSSSIPSFANSQTGYFGIGSGLIIKTTDSGATWNQISSGSGNSLNSIDKFPNGNLIAVGESGTILNNQAGSSRWTINPSLIQNNFKSVQVLNSNDVIIVDDAAMIYKSSDAGLTWEAALNGPANLSPVEDMYFNNLLEGWIIGYGFGDGALFHTTDGGSSWNPIPDVIGAYVSIDVEGSNMWAANITGLFYRSTNNGDTWIEGNLPNFPFNIQDMDFFDSNIGYAIGGGGQAFRSSDGGITWQTLPTPNINDQLTDLYLIGQNELWISTNSNKAYYSTNGGMGWAVMDVGSTGFGNFAAIISNNSENVWTVGYQGFIHHFSGSPPPPLNQPPKAIFNYNINGLTINCTDASTDIDGTIVNWNWNFGDGIFSSEQNPTHTYDTADTYIVKLIVTDDDGDVDSTIRIITVQQNPGGTFGNFTEVTPLDSVFITPQDEDFWVITTAPADYDNDGDLDIAVLGYYVVYNQSVEDRLLLLVNNGPLDSVKWNFNYINVDLANLTTGASDMAWGDADGDNDLDLAVGSDDATVIYRNDLGTLVLTDTDLPGYWEDNSQAEFDLKSISWVDFDNDADLDLLIPSVFDFNSFTFRTALMRNDGSNQTGGFIFTEVDSVFSPTKHATSMWADFDNDTDLDLLLVNMVPNSDESFIKIYKNNDNGNFLGDDILDSLVVEHGEAQWGDYDADGDLDILIAGNVRETNGTYNLALKIYQNDSGNFIPIEVIPCIPCEGWFDLTAASWADYDSDGDMDILLAGNYNSGLNIEGRARIYTNLAGIFTPDTSNTLPAPRAAGDRGGTFSWLDLDGDGDLDYFIAGQYFVPGGNGLVEAQMHVYRNDSPGLNEAPSNPSGLNAMVNNDGSVILSWIAPVDDHTPTPALTYDIKITRKGTHTPTNQGDTFNNALLQNPTRLPEPGNISAVTRWEINGLEDGLYEWSISSVDAAYLGSIISSGTFQVGNPTVAEENNKLPIEFSLAQNYPNPFNPSTLIKYSIPVEGLVTLKIFNVIGEEVVTLVNENQSVGNYTITFAPSNVSSGIYLYKLSSGSFVETKKMVLLK